jgi:alkylated DNA repair dioxygenase AlkB
VIQHDLFDIGSYSGSGEQPPAILVKGFLSPGDGASLMGICLKAMTWHQNKFSVGGQEIELPRLEAIASRSPLTYRYSGQVTLKAEVLPFALHRLMDRIETHCGSRFEFVVGNHYRDGSQHIGWHSDDEPSMGPDPVIASVSLGGSRKFQLRRKEAGSKIHDFWLEHGDLLVMLSGCQKDWIHRVPRTTSQVPERLNLTFRPWIHDNAGGSFASN